MSRLFLDGTKLMYHLEELNSWKMGQAIAPLHVELSLSSACNQRCTLCCVDHLGHPGHLLPEKVIKKLPLELKHAGVKSLLLAGEGEPLVHPQVASFTKEAFDCGIDVALNSNAVLFTQEKMENMLPYLEWARFTFQAGDEETYQRIHRGQQGDFKKACLNLENAVTFKRKHNLKVTLGVQQILLPENIKTVYQTAKLAKELGVDYFVVKRFSKHPKNTYNVPDDFYLGALEEFDRCQELKSESFNPIVRWNNFTQDCCRKYKECIGLPFIVQILATGKIYPCSMFFHEKDYCYGDLNELRFSEIIFSSKAKIIQDKIQKTQDVSKCMSYCRHHSVNQFLWQFKDIPEHVEFI